MEVANSGRSCWQDLNDILRIGVDRVFLYGPPGVGKTFAAMNFGAPSVAERLVCTEDMTSAEIMGMWEPAQEGFRYREGPGLRAWRGRDGRGGRLVVDEVDRVSGDALSMLLMITDSRESARWIHPETHQEMTPGENFSVVMTSNVTHPDDIPTALRDRFPVALHINQPPEEALAGLSPDLRGPARQAAMSPEGRRFSLRAFYSFDQLRAGLGDDQRAAEMAFGVDAAPAVLDALTISRL
jgi:MoxR-like ATPase